MFKKRELGSCSGRHGKPCFKPRCQNINKNKPTCVPLNNNPFPTLTPVHLSLQVGVWGRGGGVTMQNIQVIFLFITKSSLKRPHAKNMIRIHKLELFNLWSDLKLDKDKKSDSEIHDHIVQYVLKKFDKPELLHQNTNISIKVNSLLKYFNKKWKVYHRSKKKVSLIVVHAKTI